MKLGKEFLGTIYILIFHRLNNNKYSTQKNYKLMKNYTLTKNYNNIQHI